MLYLICIMISFYLIHNSNLKFMNSAIRLVSIMMLIFCWLLPNIRSDRYKRSDVLEWIGRNSLHVYLWHALPIVLLRFSLYKRGYEVLYYAVCILLFVMFMIFIKQRLKPQKI